MKLRTSVVANVALFIVPLAACGQSVIETSASTTAGSGGTTTSTTGSTTSTGSPPSPCGAPGCTASQLCVVPACITVEGEDCIFGAMDAGSGCPPGTVHSGQLDLDCPQPGFACVSGCPPPPPFCVDLPDACGGVATCACLAADPCAPSNSGACHDADIVGGVLRCSLMP